jgi:hypothetical protein
VVVSIVFVVYSIDSKVTMIGERKIGRVLKKQSDLIEVLYRRRIEESLNISPMITCAPYKMRLPSAVLERYAATPCQLCFPYQNLVILHVFFCIQGT